MKNLNYKLIAGFVFMFMLATDAYAQRIKGDGNMITKTRNVGSFDELGVSGSFDVELVKGEEGKLIINVENNLEQYLITEVSSGKLKIKWKNGVNIRTTKGAKVTVHFKNLSSIGLSGSGDIISSDVINADDISIAIAGSGDIELELKAKSVNAAISGSGDISLEGTTEKFVGAIAGSGDIAAYELKSEKAELKISGSGGITSNVEKELFARISGSGSIRYKGNPRIEDIKVSGSGKVSTY